MVCIVALDRNHIEALRYLIEIPPLTPPLIKTIKKRTFKDQTSFYSFFFLPFLSRQNFFFTTVSLEIARFLCSAYSPPFHTNNASSQFPPTFCFFFSLPTQVGIFRSYSLYLKRKEKKKKMHFFFVFSSLPQCCVSCSSQLDMHCHK